MAFLVVYTEELRALGRGRLTFFGLAALFAFLGFFGVAAGPEEGGKFVFLFFAYLVVPSGFGAFAAVQIAGPRANKFVQALFTAPLRRSTYLASKFLVVLTVGVLYLLFTLPVLGVYALHVGVPEVFGRFLLIGLGMVLFGAAYGFFLGVCFTGRSLAAPVSLGVLPIFLILCVPFLAIAGAAPSKVVRDLYVRVIHASPQVNLLDATRANPIGYPLHGDRSLWAFGASVSLLLLVAAWIYLVHQSVETWHGAKAARTVAVLVGVAAILLPTLVPAMDYGPEPKGADDTPEREGHTMGTYLVARGARPDASALERHDPQNANLRIPLSGPTPADLLVLLPPGPDTGYTRVTVAARAYDGLRMTGTLNVVLDPFQARETFRVPGADQPAVAVRLPVTVEPQTAEGLTGVRYRIVTWINSTWLESPPSPEGEPPPDGEAPPPQPHTEKAVATAFVTANLDGARQNILAAVAVPPTLFLLVGVVRAVRRR